MMAKYRQIIIGICIGLVFCIAIEFVIYKLNHSYNFFGPYFTTTVSPDYEVHQGGGNFTNPLLECYGVEGGDSFAQLHISEPELDEYVDKTISSYGLSTMSVYVRDMNDGPWIGVNEDTDFIGGSLLKVPMLISYLKLSESDPTILQKVVDYPKQLTSNVQYFSPSKQIEPGNKYTINDLLTYMIEYSDNNAAELLLQNINSAEFDKVFEAMGLGEPDPNNPYSVDTKTYSGFFRILFNASYLDKDDSEKALALLSKSEFNRGLEAGLPNNIIVSHKFGIRTDNDVNQLHDCGIVYYPGHPYLLCVMSRGGTFDHMASSIADVSKFVYEKVSQTN